MTTSPTQALVARIARLAASPICAAICAAFCAALGAAVGASVAAQDVAPPDRLRAVRDELAAAVEAGRTPAVSVAVLADDDVVWAEGIGIADPARGRGADADTIYRLASISKPFTATAIALLAERGVVDLDAPVDRWLAAPGVRAFAGRADDVTLRRLLNHTAGLPTHWNFFYAGSTPPPRAETIARHGFTAWPPGTRTNYSNLAFGILDEVVARASQRTYRDFLVTELLDPLGMTHTDLGVRPEREDHAAVACVRGRDGRFEPVADYGFDHDGASAVRGSARDLMRFARLFLGEGEVDGRRILRRETVLAMRERRARDAGSEYGIGWSVLDVRGGTLLRHTGGMPGVATVLHVYPERRAAIAVLTNSGERELGNRAVAAIAEVLFDAEPKPEASAPRAEVARADAGPARAEAPAAADPGAAIFGRFAGILEHAGGPRRVELELGADSVRLNIGGVDVPVSRTASARAGQVRLRGGPAALPTLSSFAGEPRLELDLEHEALGLHGVCYAVADSFFRLPHWLGLAPADPPPPETLRVVTWNVLVGFADSSVGDPYLPGVQRRQHASAWLAAIEPDVVALQEMNGWDEAALLRQAAVWGHAHAAVLKADGYPVALTSRTPIEVVERRVDGLHHGLLHCRTDGVDFVVVHVVPFAGVARKLREVEAAVARYSPARAAGRPVVVLGDFNCVSAHDTPRLSAEALARYAKWQWPLENGAPAELALAPLDAAGAVDVLLRHRGERPDPLPLPRIDFVFASPDLAARSRACRWLAEPERLRWSDHPAVVADFARAR